MLKNILSTIFTKGFVALINLAILLVSSKQLGGDIRGQISLLILNIAIIQLINEIYTGYALVYFIPKFSLKKVYSVGVLWTVIFTIICTIALGVLFLFFKIGSNDQWLHLLILSFIIILHSFHGVIILAKERIKIYNFLNFFQPFLLLTTLMVCIFYAGYKSVNSYIIALYVSFGTSLIFSSLQMLSVFKHEEHKDLPFEPKQIVKNGFFNQLANLSHMLSNRYNFYLLGNTALVGVFSSSSSLIESIWIISGSVSPIILTYIANAKNPNNNSRITFLLAKLCFLLSVFCVVVLLFIPVDFFTFLLGKDFSNTKNVMLFLSPGILFISFSTIISHYFAGLGKQKYIVLANGLGLISTIALSPFFIARYQLIGACYATCVSYFVASIVLTVLFMRENKFNLLSLFTFKNDLKLLKNV
jgi:O-antigen/teichoic acid export membrane protein